jgi:foldase protein PrsA
VTRLPRIFGLFALVLALVAGACGNSLGETIRPAAATVNGESISQKELDDELEAIQGNEDYIASIEAGGLAVTGQGAGTLTNAFVSRVLTRQIFLKLVHDEVERRKLEVTDDQLERVRPGVIQSVGGDEIFERFPSRYRDTLVRRNAEVALLQSELGGSTVSDADVRDFYDENPELFAQTCVSHILFGVTDDRGQLDQEATAAEIDRLTGEAAAAKAQIDAGADFAAVAAERSVDTSNKDEGGDLECGPPGRFVPEFETAMDALDVGVVSDPVATQFGVHLIKVTDRGPQPLDEAEGQIRQRLEGAGEQAFSQFLQEALEEAEITVNPRYGRFTKEGQSPGIIPPDAPTTTVPGDAGRGSDFPDPLRP